VHPQAAADAEGAAGTLAHSLSPLWEGLRAVLEWPLAQAQAVAAEGVESGMGAAQSCGRQEEKGHAVRGGGQGRGQGTLGQ
jgi:hypothetical protein